jgi:hypothetical protein
MADVHIDEVHTDLQISSGVGSLSPEDVRKLVALVMAQLKAQQHNEALRDRDDRLRGSAYLSDVTE